MAMNIHARRWEGLTRKHPGLMFVAVIVAAATATLILLTQPQGPVVLYQAF